MIELIFPILILLILIVASYIDIKHKEIPDSISIIIAIIGLVSLIVMRNNIFVALLMTIIVFSFSYMLYANGLWGGGDAKVLTALTLYLSNFSYIGSLTYIFLMALSGIIYNNFVAFLYLPKMIQKDKLNQKVLLLSLAGFIIAILLKSWIFALVILLGFDLYYFRRMEKEVMKITKKTKDLTEGDWLMSKVKNVPPRKTGLSLEDIKEIKRQKIKQVKIKDGFAFLPAIALAFLVFFLMVCYNVLNLEVIYDYLLMVF